MQLLLIAGLGMVGVGLRWLCVGFFPNFYFSWGVLTVNIFGGFLAGFFYAHPRFGADLIWREALLVGLLGAFTTFSSFALDNARLIQQSQWSLLVLNIALNNILSIAACVFAVKIATPN